jgi:aminoglycoside phosphotransferase (APT) family kinase protein
MEFVKGRIITDPNLSTLAPTERRAAWSSVICTLAWLHTINADAIGLSDFGKKTDFYRRHCNTFSRIEAQQAQVKDVKTGAELGRAHPHFDEIVDYIRRNAPTDRASIVHGDYKFDNIVLHPTEPRVVAILDWELSTIGNPLMDAVYAVGPYWNRASGSAQVRDDQGGEVYDPQNQRRNGMPSMDELMDEYSMITGWDPRRDQWEIAKVFHLMRVGLFDFIGCCVTDYDFAGQYDQSWYTGTNDQWTGEQ